MEKYPLKHPFDITIPSEGDEPTTKKISEVEIPEKITARHMRAMRISEGEMSAMIDLIGAFSELTPAQMDKMDMEDVIGVMGKLPLAQELFRTTGVTS
ncbi:MAG: hypothetical protein GKR93_11920 [Gammaproteobacteria bacterium]|nr:hypothetical protein [Gammaproteobacteria bacterium]